MRISQLEGQRVALWGWGREGRAAYRAIRARLPALALTLFCKADEIADADALGDGLLRVEVEVTGERLGAFETIIKSPGISAYANELVEATALGTRFVGGTALWFAERPEARTICITGTKGKSTTTALLAHLLRAGGHRTVLAGNIGLPLLDCLDVDADYWAIELSSYQTRDVAASNIRPTVAVVLNVFPEHLDWHGGEQRYVEDKLALLTGARPHVAILNAADPRLAGLSLPDSELHWFGRRDGWHLRGSDLHRGDEFVLDTSAVALPGRHNRSNLCAVLTAIEALGLDAAALAPHAASFQPLPHRLQTLGMRDGITWVNDSISTTPHASLAALEVFRGQRVAILVGGHDRGIEWGGFADAMRTAPPAAVVTMGQNGRRIHELLGPIAAVAGFDLRSSDDLGSAMEQARDAVGKGGVILLSPGAPSFGPYRDYTERGRDFARIAGFDPDAIASIAGLGAG